MAKPMSKGTRDDILALHEQGLSRGEIAERIGTVSAFSISKVVEAAGRTFERKAQTAAAITERKRRLEELRQELALGMLEDAAWMREKLRKPTVVYNFGGKDNDYNETTLEEPPIAGLRDLTQAISTASATSMKLTAFDADNSGAASSVMEWLSAMGVPGVGARA